ncbi:MAG: FAD-binding protein [Vicinamibacterales bacterium]
MPLAAGTRAAFAAVVGDDHARDDEAALTVYGADALQRGSRPDLVLLPGSVGEVSAIARHCDAERIPLVVRGAGTGYTGGAVPVRGGIVVSMERFDRILEIDDTNMLAVVQPNVLTGRLQEAVEARGLFYPPDPASLHISAIGGNVAECAGGPRAVKYGTTRRYVLALQAVLPTGEVIRTGSKAVKNVVGYDLTQLLVGSGRDLAILTEITLRLCPGRPPSRRSARHSRTSARPWTA